MAITRTDIFETACMGVSIASALLFLALVFSIIWKSDPEFESPLSNITSTTTLNKKLNNRQRDSLLHVLVAQNSLIKDSLQSVNNKIILAKKDTYLSEEKVKYYGALIGLIFTITGLFGLKSINDIRDSSIKQAASDAKDTAEKEAKRVATEISKDTAKATAEETAKQIATQVAAEKSEKVAAEIAEKIANNKSEEILRASISDYKTDIKDLRDYIKQDHKFLASKFETFKREVDNTLISLNQDTVRGDENTPDAPENDEGASGSDENIFKG